MKHRSELFNAFSLVEVTLALGIAAFCLIGIFALIPTSLSTSQISMQQTVDTSWARMIAADLCATPKTSPPTDQNSPRYGITIPVTTAPGTTVSHTIFLQEDGTATAQDTDANAAQNPKYRATITFAAPANSSQKTATNVTILLTWPALADKAAATLPTKFTGSYEVFTALNRN
jgi:uncharacterized protein (TIGR02598 family)